MVDHLTGDLTLPSWQPNSYCCLKLCFFLVPAPTFTNKPKRDMPPAWLKCQSVYLFETGMRLYINFSIQNTISSVYTVFRVYVNVCIFISVCARPHSSWSAATLPHSQTHISWLDGFSVRCQGPITYLWNPSHSSGVKFNKMRKRPASDKETPARGEDQIQEANTLLRLGGLGQSRTGKRQ